MANFLSPPLPDSFPSTLPREDATPPVMGRGGATDGAAASETVALDLPEWVWVRLLKRIRKSIITSYFHPSLLSLALSYRFFLLLFFLFFFQMLNVCRILEELGVVVVVVVAALARLRFSRIFRANRLSVSCRLRLEAIIAIAPSALPASLRLILDLVFLLTFSNRRRPLVSNWSRAISFPLLHNEEKEEEEEGAPDFERPCRRLLPAAALAGALPHLDVFLDILPAARVRQVLSTRFLLVWVVRDCLRFARTDVKRALLPPMPRDDFVGLPPDPSLLQMWLYYTCLIVSVLVVWWSLTMRETLSNNKWSFLARSIIYEPLSSLCVLSALVWNGKGTSCVCICI